MSVDTNTTWARGSSPHKGIKVGETVQLALPVLGYQYSRELSPGLTVEWGWDFDPSAVHPDGLAKVLAYGLVQYLADGTVDAKGSAEIRAALDRRKAQIETGEAASRGDAVLTRARGMLLRARRKLGGSEIEGRAAQKLASSRDTLGALFLDVEVSSDKVSELVAAAISKAEAIIALEAEDLLA